MADLVYTMRADLQQAAGQAVDVGPLLGAWLNVYPETENVVQLTVEERDGDLVIHLYGAGSPQLIDWGTTSAVPFVAGGGTRAMGFHACYEFPGVRTEVASNEKLGVLVIQSYTTFTDGSGRPSHFAREFFCRQPALSVEGAVPVAGIGA